MALSNETTESTDVLYWTTEDMRNAMAIAYEEGLGDGRLAGRLGHERTATSSGRLENLYREVFNSLPYRVGPPPAG